ncbi:MAG: hypothetical protein AB7F28_04815 [Candidatus Margulisiibacteriota bacterium]
MDFGGFNPRLINPLGNSSFGGGGSSPGYGGGGGQKKKESTGGHFGSDAFVPVIAPFDPNQIQFIRIAPDNNFK